MSGGRRNDEENNKKEGGGGGRGSTFLKGAGIAVATAAVAGRLYSLLEQPEVAPLQVRRTDHHEEVSILKVDGSLLPGPLAGCGGYLSSAGVKWICGFAQKLDPALTLRVDQAEKEAILRGLLWVKEKGKKKVVVKSDNAGVVYSVNCGGRSNDPLVCGIRDLLNSPHWEATLSRIPGEENKVADRLAHKAHKLNSFRLDEFDVAPQNCVFLL